MRILLVVVFSMFFLQVSAQDYALKPVTMKGTFTWKQLFQEISSQTGVIFSYTNSDVTRKKTVNWQQRALKSVLDELFEGSSTTYRFKGKYVILTQKQAPQTVKTTRKIAGQVWTIPDSVPLAGASIYIRESRQVCHTDEQGHFQLNVPNAEQELYVQVAREGYQDTAQLCNTRQHILNFYLRAKPMVVEVEIKSIDSTQLKVEATQESKKDSLKAFNRLKLLDRFNQISLRNIQDTLFNYVSFSLFPPISTNKLLSIHTVNRFAFNLLVGHSKGIDGFELGGLINIDNGSVRYGQIAGLCNFVYGNFHGIQIGGLSNQVRDKFIGMQIGGIYNRSGRFTGMQVAGIANQSGNFKGLQIAGLLNDADLVDGAQISGIVNLAGKVRGVQIGLINISDSLQGVSLGLFTFVRKGYHKLELSMDEQKQYNISFRTGNNWLHQIFQLTSDFTTSAYQPGFGLGTAIRLHKSKKWYLGAETTGSGVMDPRGLLTSKQGVARLFLGLEYRPLKWLNVFAGAGINALIYDANAAQNSLLTYPVSAYAINSTSGANAQIWNSWRFGIRLF